MEEALERDNDNILNALFDETKAPVLDDTDDALDSAIFVIDLDELDHKTKARAQNITEKLADYYFDKKYIEKHPYIRNKIGQEMDNIRRLLKMLSVNERAQDTLIMSITSHSGKGTLYGALTSLQNSMLSMQTQLNNLTANLESIFREMQADCEQTFEEKDKEIASDGSMTVRGSREFIKDINRMINGEDYEDKSPDETVPSTIVYDAAADE